MRKSLLLMSAMAFCAWGMSAQLPMETSPVKSIPVQKADVANEINYHYYVDGKIEGLSAQVSSGEVWLAASMPKEVSASYAGNQITSVNLVTPVNKTTNVNYVLDVTVFLSKGRTDVPFYTQKATLPVTSETFCSVALDTPYEIQGNEEIWYGYYFKLTRNIASKMYWVAVDGVSNNDTNTGWAKISDQWQNVNEYGSALVGMNIKGDKLPKNIAGVRNIDLLTPIVNRGDFDYTVEVINRGANEVSSLEIESVLGQGVKDVQTVNLEKAIAFGETATVKLSYTAMAAGESVPFVVSVNKVNGVENTLPEGSIAENMVCFPAGWNTPQRVLIEEATGTWCPNCPLGYLTMEYAREKYTDGRLVLISPHNNDEMTSLTYNKVIEWGFSGFPQYLINRMELGGYTTSMEYNKAVVDAYYEAAAKTLGKARVDLYLDWTDDTKENIHATVQSHFAFPLKGTYKIAFAVVEDGVGPYKQKNNFSSLPDLGIFTGNAEPMCMYNDVARDIFSPFGLAQSSIFDPDNEQYYTFSYDVSLANAKDLTKTRIVAMLLDATTYEVVNCAEMQLNDAAGADQVIGENTAVKITTQLGAVVVNGASVTEVYTIDGRRAATAYGEASINLPAGIYIVKADNKVEKVIVK